MMGGKLEMKERLARAIAGERFRRHIGPGWRDIAHQAAEIVMEELGMQEVEASQIYPAREGPKIEAYIEGSLMATFADKVSKETPMRLIIERGKASDHTGLSRIRLRGWVITRSAPHDQ